MPKKLMDCIKRVMDSGKDESAAWAICQKSTGLKPHKKKKAKSQKPIPMLLSLADDLDRAGFREEADGLNKILQKEAQWQWLKEKGQQFKDWFKTEQEMDPQKRQVLADIRKTHWDLIDKINKAYTLLDNAGRSMYDPETYKRDLGQALDVLQRDLGAALEASKQQAQRANEIGMGLQQQPTGGSTPAAAPPRPGQALQNLTEKQKARLQGGGGQITTTPGAGEQARKLQEERMWQQREQEKRQSISISTLLKVADTFDSQGKFNIADRIDSLIKKAQFGLAKDIGTQIGDRFRAQIGTISESVRQKHYDILKRLKNLYNNLQGLRQNITSPDYLSQFQRAITEAQKEFNNLLMEAQQIEQEIGRQPTGQPTGEGVRQPAGESAGVSTPAPAGEVPEETAEFQRGTGSSEPFISIDDLRRALNGLPREVRREVLEAIQAVRKKHNV